MKKAYKLIAVLFTSLLSLTSCDLFSNASSSSSTLVSSTIPSSSNNDSSSPSSSSSSSSSNTSNIVLDYPSVNPCKTRTGKKDKAKNLVVYAVNDTHGAIEDTPESYQAGLAKIREYVCKDSDYDPDYSVILSAGDMFQGTGISNLTEGLAMTHVMNAFPFDAMAVGNHEFDWGLDFLLTNIEKTRKFEVLANNIYAKGKNEVAEGMKPYTIIDRGGYKIGVIGSIEHGIDSSIMYNKLTDYSIVSDVDITKNQAAQLKKDGADLVLLLTHQGATDNVKTILEAGNIDAAILGHTHAFISETINSIPMLEARANGQALTKIVFNKSGELVSSAVHSFSKSEINSLTVSADMRTLLDAIHKKVDPILNEKITTVNGSLLRYESTYTAGNLSSLITQLMYNYGKKYSLDNVIAVYNKGGLRSDFKCTSSTCTLTYGDVYQMCPFENEVRVVPIKGTRLESSIQSHFYYGVDFTTNKLVDGRNFDTSKTYNVVTLDYLTTTPGYPLYASDGGKILGNKKIYVRDMIKEELTGVKQIDIADYPF
ncbi:MAG TPA: hypothetical protein DCY93_03800 [Firmicutes bacterium]|nr:hypothetical protein [Bacillota bacterium]